MWLVRCPVVVLGYKTQRHLGEVIEQLLHLNSLPALLNTMPLENTCRYRHARGKAISHPCFPAPELGIEGYPCMEPAEVRVVFQVVGIGSDTFQIVSHVKDLTEYQRYRIEYLGNLVFDDLVWHQSIVSLECLQTFRGLRADPDDSVFWNLLMQGVLYLEPSERPNDASAQAVCYSAVMGDQLWAMVQGEHLRVCRLRSHGLIPSNHLDIGRELGERCEGFEGQDRGHERRHHSDCQGRPRKLHPVACRPVHKLQQCSRLDLK